MKKPMGPVELTLSISMKETTTVTASAAFVCPAAAIYKKRHTLRGAAAGLATGVVLMTALMLLWNYFITPLYMGYPREAVAAMLLPVFLPFNLIKSALNAALTMLVYKPVSRALKRSGLVESVSETAPQSGRRLGAMLIAALVLASCIVAVLVMRGVI